MDWELKMLSKISYNAPLRTNGCCHSLIVFKYPKECGEYMKIISTTNQMY